MNKMIRIIIIKRIRYGYNLEIFSDGTVKVTSYYFVGLRILELTSNTRTHNPVAISKNLMVLSRDEEIIKSPLGSKPTPVTLCSWPTENFAIRQVSHATPSRKKKWVIAAGCYL